MQSFMFVAAFALTVLLVAIFPSSSEAWVIERAIRTESECKQPCTDLVDCNHFVNCKHGSEIDNCGRKQCTKGPDERCGGKKGNCAKGLICTECNLCGGCSSKTMTCSQFAYDCLLPSPGFY